jgi:hypothetical protein
MIVQYGLALINNIRYFLIKTDANANKIYNLLPATFPPFLLPYLYRAVNSFISGQRKILVVLKPPFLFSLLQKQYYTIRAF